MGVSVPLQIKMNQLNSINGGSDSTGNLMSGTYRGQSTPTDPTKPATLWTECHMSFTPKTATVVCLNSVTRPSSHTISGRGSSMWRNEVIQFQLVGSFDESTSRFELFKTHTGRFTNTQVYDGYVSARLDAQTGIHNPHLVLRYLLLTD